MQQGTATRVAERRAGWEVSAVERVTPEQLARAEQLTRLAALNEAQQALTSSLQDHEGSVRLLAHYAGTLVDADGAAVLLVDGEDLVLAGTAGAAAGNDGSRVVREGSAAERVLAFGEVLHSEDTETDERVDLGRCRAVGARSLLLVPIQAGARPVGALVAFSGHPGAFDLVDQQILCLLSGFTGAAMRTAVDHERIVDAEREQVRLVEDLERSQQRFTAAFRGSPIGMAIVRDGLVSEANGALHAMLRYPAGELVGLRVDRMLPTEEMPALAALRAGADAPGRHGEEFRLRRGDGSRMWALVSSSTLPDEVPGRCSLLQVIDFGERKERERKLLHRASHDELTGLPNRAQLLDRLADALAAAAEPAEVLVLFCDLDGFKAINDTHGHAAGDAVLRMVATRLRDLVRTGDTVGRLGGDEFVILPSALDARGALALAERARVALARPLPWEDRMLQVRASIGIATGRPSAAATLRAADAAMYEQKQRAG